MMEDLDRLKSLNDCGEWIDKWCMRLAHVAVPWKNKYGQLRIEDICIARTWHSFMYPGYVYYQWPRWLSWIDIYHGDWIFNWTGGYLIRLWQKFIVRRVFNRAMTKWPYWKWEIGSALRQVEP